jgi:crotonobetainyl-CoA:carnitine CoA-transferase CaiB-like acyl-CoA transferase
VRSLDEVFCDPQIEARQMQVQVSHPLIGPLPVLGTPLKLSDTPAMIRTAPPTLGAHTEQVLRGDLGLSELRVQSLRDAGVI